nr:hypothetical protein [Streptomyces adustus]
MDNARAEAGERFVRPAELFDGVTRGHFDRLDSGRVRGAPARRRTASAKKQTQVRLEEAVLEAGRAAARARRPDYDKYVERLVIEDTTGARAAGMTAAQKLIDAHGSFLDDLEQQLDAPYADPQPGATPPRTAHRTGPRDEQPTRHQRPDRVLPADVETLTGPQRCPDLSSACTSLLSFVHFDALIDRESNMTPH